MCRLDSRMSYLQCGTHGAHRRCRKYPKKSMEAGEFSIKCPLKLSLKLFMFKVCTICRQRQGACIQCAHKNCFTAFHVTCARKAKFYMKMRGQSADNHDFKCYCEKHSPVGSFFSISNGCCDQSLIRRAFNRETTGKQWILS